MGIKSLLSNDNILAFFKKFCNAITSHIWKFKKPKNWRYTDIDFLKVFLQKNLDGKLESKVVDQFGKRKISQRKVLEQIRDVEHGRKIEEKTIDKKQNLEIFKTVKKTKKKEEAIITPAKEKKEQAEDEVKYCKICRLGVQLTCPACKETIVLCERYKN